MNSRKAVSPMIVSLLLMGISIAAIALMWFILSPYLDQFTETSKFERAKDLMNKIDEKVEEVALGAQGSKAELQVVLEDLVLEVDEGTDRIFTSFSSHSAAVAEGRTFRQDNIYYEKTGTLLTIGLDYNNTAIDINSSTEIYRGSHTIVFENLYKGGGKVYLDVRVK